MPINADPLLLCAPSIYPFMTSTVYDAIVTDAGYKTAVGKTSSVEGEDMATVPFNNDSALLYDVSMELARDRLTPAKLIFGISHHTTSLANATKYDKECIYAPPADDSTDAFGTSFFVVIITMGVIVLCSSLLVWFKYVRTSKEDKERLSKLRGLSFAFKQENNLYGRDLMIPEMYRKWLPREVCKAEQKKAIQSKAFFP